jgi:hypothetical protein
MHITPLTINIVIFGPFNVILFIVTFSLLFVSIAVAAAAVGIGIVGQAAHINETNKPITR